MTPHTQKKEVIHSVLEVAHFVLLSSHAPVCQDICFLLRFTRLLWFSGRTKYWLFFITAGWPRSHGWRSRAVQISFPISLRWGLAAPCLGFRDFSATMKMFLVRLFEWYPFSALKLFLLTNFVCHCYHRNLQSQEVAKAFGAVCTPEFYLFKKVRATEKLQRSPDVQTAIIQIATDSLSPESRMAGGLLNFSTMDSSMTQDPVTTCL